MIQRRLNLTGLVHERLNICFAVVDQYRISLLLLFVRVMFAVDLVSCLTYSWLSIGAADIASIFRSFFQSGICWFSIVCFDGRNIWLILLHVF